MSEQDHRTVSELFAAATDWTLEDGSGDWAAVIRLHLLGTREVFDRALALTTSDDARARARGADILGQLGIPDRTFPEEGVKTVVELVRYDHDPLVLEAAAVALGHLCPSADAESTGAMMEALVRIADNTDPDVRHAVAFALAGRVEPEAIATLVRLTRDEVAHVRDWATFGLGAMGKVNTAEIREALRHRLDDADDDTRYEAVCGLARCGDQRVIPDLIDRLSNQPDDFGLPDAAKALLKIDYNIALPREVLIEKLKSLAEST